MIAINISMVGLLIAMTWLGALGGYFLKKASSFDFRSEQKKVALTLMTGVLFYGAGAVLNIIALRYLPYTIVFPLTAVTYIWTMILSYAILKEKIGIRKIAGILLIVSGAVILVS